MWSREVLKTRAKEVLKTNYWKAFLISLVIVISGNGGGGGGGGSDQNRDSVKSFVSDVSNGSIDDRTFFIIIFAVIALFIAYRILIGYPLEVGGRKYFVQSAQYKDNSKCISFAFDRQNYYGLILTMFLKGLYNFLWFLLLIIPGIVKFYAYSMVPYILSDNPNIGAKRAIELSNEMTNGHKLDMFVLHLSFLGWYLLGALALGIGVFFVNPYAFATEAELYLVLRGNMLDNDMHLYEELIKDTKNY